MKEQYVENSTCLGDEGNELEAVELHESYLGTQRLEAMVRMLDRSRLDPMRNVSKTIKKYLWRIINAIVLRVSNGPAERINRRIKTIKVRARGFRNHERFANAIYFYLGGLDLYPVGYQNRSTH